jgi:hypothetical protein
LRFVRKMKRLKERLKKLDPDYSISYGAMCQLVKKLVFDRGANLYRFSPVSFANSARSCF